MRIPKAIIGCLGTAIVGLVMVALTASNDDLIGVTLLGALLLIGGGIATTVLFVVYLAAPPKVDLPEGEKSGFMIRILGVCMFVCGFALLGSLGVAVINGTLPASVRRITGLLALAGLFFYGGWQMATGKV